jgi:hypothetical protein
LYKVLTQQIVPYVVNKLKVCPLPIVLPAILIPLQENERKQRAEAAIVHRKRSSRIAIKESEKEEARLLALRKAEEEEKQSRARRIEARQQKEAFAREKREAERERRRREREEKEAGEAVSERYGYSPLSITVF